MSPNISSFVTHEELGLNFVEDQVNLAPLLLWISVWANESLRFNRSVIEDCMECMYGHKIPWIHYIKLVARSLNRMDIFDRPNFLKKGDHRLLMETFLNKAKEERESYCRDCYISSLIYRFLSRQISSNH